MIAGIDPGMAGAICLLNNDGSLYEIIDMPTIERQGKKELQVYHINSFLARNRDLGTPYSNYAAIELVHAMPKNGVTSMFNFGKGYGSLLTVVELSRYRRVDVRPQVWKKHFNLIGKDKRAGYDVIEQLLPGQDKLFFTIRGRLLDGRVDAYLIARWLYDDIQRAGGKAYAT